MAHKFALGLLAETSPTANVRKHEHQNDAWNAIYEHRCFDHAEIAGLEPALRSAITTPLTPIQICSREDVFSFSLNYRASRLSICNLDAESTTTNNLQISIWHSLCSSQTRQAERSACRTMRHHASSQTE